MRQSQEAAILCNIIRHRLLPNKGSIHPEVYLTQCITPEEEYARMPTFHDA